VTNSMTLSCAFHCTVEPQAFAISQTGSIAVPW
jgi:hypothetical protein